jgi:hypothetical protein
VHAGQGHTVQCLTLVRGSGKTSPWRLSSALANSGCNASGVVTCTVWPRAPSERSGDMHTALSGWGVRDTACVWVCVGADAWQLATLQHHSSASSGHYKTTKKIRVESPLTPS